MKLHELLNEAKYNENLLPKGGTISVEYSGQFLKDFFFAEQKYKSRLTTRFNSFVGNVSNNLPVDSTYQLHKMKGAFGVYDPSKDILMDAHILNDTVAIYVLDKKASKILFLSIGSHSQLKLV